MKFRLEKIIGRNKIVFEGEANSNLEFFKNISFYATLPYTCGNCTSPEIYPTYHETKEGYRYCKILCATCQHALNFGMYKEGNGALFQKKWELNNFNKQQEEEFSTGGIMEGFTEFKELGIASYIEKVTSEFEKTAGTSPSRYYPSRRDYFAAAIMSGCINHPGLNITGGTVAYLVDALIAELDRTEKK